jgi:hypothetical protein
MATDLIMPRPPDQQHASFYPQLQGYSQPAPLQQTPVPVYPPQQQYNPTQVSPLSSANASPTSPRSYHGRQNRPLFMPAVLRPTEFPSKAPPQKPKAKADAVAENDDDRPMRSSGSFMSLPGLNGFGRLSRRSTGDPGNSVFGKWNLDVFPVPRGAPSQQHWKVSFRMVTEGGLRTSAVLTFLFSSLMRRPLYAMTRPASDDSAPGRDATTVANAEIFSAMRTLPTRSRSTKISPSTHAHRPSAPAATAMASSRYGVVALTARSRRAPHLSTKLRLACLVARSLRRRGQQLGTSALRWQEQRRRRLPGRLRRSRHLRWRRACRGIGIGVLSERLIWVAIA